MLTEFKDVRQRPEEGFRRWFSDAVFDVILWYDREGGEIRGFQLCYDKRHEERAFTKKKESRILRSHRYVSNGPNFDGANKMTSVLKGDAGKVDEVVLRSLMEEAGDLGPEIATMIVSEIEGWNKSLAQTVQG